jgi:hypothetical protein
MGPWYALNENPRCLYIDRAYWGDPQAVSISWYDNRKLFDWADKPARQHPQLQPEKPVGRTVILCDYGMTGVEELRRNPGATIRRHPSEQQAGESLADCLNAHSKAVGRHTTALVDAAIAGLEVEADAAGPCGGLRFGREHWIRCLAWHNWTKTEIESGYAFETFIT